MNINILKRKYNRGLTLIELMVVIAIFLVITGVVIFDYGSFRSNVSLQNLTDDVALSIRKAQSFAIGVRGVSKGGIFVFSDNYGVHFSMNSIQPIGALSGSNKSFLMFSADSSLKYTEPIVTPTTCGDVSNNSCLELFKITSADFVEDIIYTIGSVDHSSLSENSNQASVDIVFKRPNPRAEFCYKKTLSVTEDCLDPSPSSISIVMSNGETALSGRKKIKKITVQNTGQISIQ